MSEAKRIDAHVIDVLGNVVGRDQPIMRVDKAIALVSCIDNEVFLREDVVFFDPFCKAGELLLASAYIKCLEKSLKRSSIMDVDLIHKEIFQSNRYFALAPDERHHRLSLRTFLGNEYSHKNEFNKIIRNGNYLSEVDGTLDRGVFEREFRNMIEFIKEESGDKKIVAVGNPPYQESDGGFGKSASPIYSYFVEALMDCEEIEQFVLVIPSRWFSGGKGLKNFRRKVLNSESIKAIKAFKDPREVFPTVDINGGVCFIVSDKANNSGCNFIDGDEERNVCLSTLDAIPDDLMAYELIEKINEKCNRFMSDYVLPRNPFGITSTTLRSIKSNEIKDSVALIKERQRLEIPSRLIKKNHELVEMYKVAVPAAVGGTKAVRDFLPVNQFFIVEPGIAFSETYIVIGSFETMKEAEVLLSYLQTSFCRYFIGLRKLTQHLSRECWSWVPQVPFDKVWTDAKLAKYFGLSEKQMSHIIQKVEEWS